MAINQACRFHPPKALQVEVARSGALEAFGSLEEWLKVHPEVGRTEWKARDPFGYPIAQEEKHRKNINIYEIFIIYYIYRFLPFFSYGTSFIYVPLFWYMKEIKKTTNNYICLHLILTTYIHVPLLPFKINLRFVPFISPREVASLMGSNSPWQM